MTVKAIETKYAGCRFRSRLEARWARFFDELGIAWEYEPQGYEVTSNGDPDEKPERYLPDFELPDLGVFVEVKGWLNERDLRRLVKAVIPHGLSLDAQGDPAIIMLGQVPRMNRLIDYNYARPSHQGLFFAKGDVYSRPYAWTDAGSLECLRESGLTSLGNDWGQIDWNLDTSADLLKERQDFNNPCPSRVVDAYTAARSARFEHGERG